MKEIEMKKKIVVNKVVYSKGLYSVFTITARCYQTAVTELSINQFNFQGGIDTGYKSNLRQ